MKKRRLSASGVSKSIMGFATVADSSKPDVTMTLVDTDNRFTNDLREARDTNKVLIINNVFTRKQSEVLGDNSVVGEVVLVPSKNSVVDWEWKTDNDPQHHSMPSTLETESQGYLLQKNITLLACLVDIEISGKLLNASKCLESPTSFVQGMITSDQEQYRPVTLHLESFGTSSTIHCPREVLASPGIIQTLCGGIEAKELTHDELLQRSVFDLVQAMLRDQVKLKWSIRMDCQPFAVEHVVLPAS
jgi:hypothetical protein